MPQPFSKSDLQKLLDASSTDEVAGMLKDHGYEVEGDSGEGGGDSASTPGGPPPKPPPFGGGGGKSPFSGGSDPFEKRKDVAKRAMKKVGMPDMDEES